MKQTKKEISLREKLAKYNLKENQLEPIIKLYRKSKDDVATVDQAIRFSDINEGLKVRDFVFVYTNGCETKRGVYKIKFGSKFYIGRAKYIETRMKSHWREITNFFSSGKYAPESYYSKICEHLKEEQMAYYFEVDLLEECYTVQDLLIAEQKWLDKYKDNPKCLNVGFKAKKPHNEIDETPEEMKERKTNLGVVTRGGRLIFYPKNSVKKTLHHGKKDSIKKYTPEKKKAANSFKFNIDDFDREIQSCVFKLFYGDRYIIHKGKYLAFSIDLLEKNYGYFLAYQHTGTSFTKDHFYNFYDYIRKNEGLKFRLEVISDSTDALELLKTEHLELNKAIRDKKCINSNIEIYIPKFNEKTGMHNWITVDQVDQFYSFVKSI